VIRRAEAVLHAEIRMRSSIRWSLTYMMAGYIFGQLLLHSRFPLNILDGGKSYGRDEPTGERACALVLCHRLWPEERQRWSTDSPREGRDSG
jgi:hypothetical protein